MITLQPTPVDRFDVGDTVESLGDDATQAFLDPIQSAVAVFSPENEKSKAPVDAGGAVESGVDGAEERRLFPFDHLRHAGGRFRRLCTQALKVLNGLRVDVLNHQREAFLLAVCGHPAPHGPQAG